jgi:type II secretory pathway pseudopilin PulG
VRQQVNLYQPLFRKQEKKFSATAMLQSIGVILVAIVLLIAWTQWQVTVLKGERERADQQLVAAAKRLEEVARQFGGGAQGETVEDEVARLEQQLATKQQIRGVLGQGLFGNTQGFSDYFTALARQHLPGLWLTGFEIVGAAEQLTLQGRSASGEAVPRYVQKLAAESRLAGIEFRVFQIERPTTEGKPAAAYLNFTLKTASGAGAVKSP